MLISKVRDRKFVCYFHFIGIENISLGITLNLLLPNIEIHIPGGFFRIGWVGVYQHVPVWGFGWNYSWNKHRNN